MNNKRVLVVDDDKEFLGILKKKLAKDNIPGIYSDSAREGLDILKSQNNIGLVILDLLMPEMSGWAFVRELSKLKLDGIQIIILSNLSDTSYPETPSNHIEKFVKADISLKELVDKIRSKLPGH